MKRTATLSVIVCLLFPAAARADVAGQGGWNMTVSHERASERGEGRLTGGGVAAYGDIRGFGMTIGLDYQNIPKREDGAVLFGHSVGFHIGARLSPVAMIDREAILGYLDLYGAAAVEGGLAYRNGRVGGRESPYWALGAELRAGNGRPGLVIEHRWRGDRDSEFELGSTFVVGVSFVSSGRTEVRD